jgi:adenosylcobinamide-GDP ribazoletransferase
MSGESFRTTVRQQFNIFLAALMFMTRLPVGKGYVFRSEDLPRSAVYFPIVGAMIGSLGGLVLLCAEPFFPPVVAVLFCMGTTVLVTGALHEDGLADAMDGLLGGQEPRRRLEIMRDSRLGSYGAVALWFSLTAKAFVLTSLLEDGAFKAVTALIVAQGLGRAATVALLFSQPYVRSDQSKASPFGNAVTLKETLLALIFPVFLSFVLLGNKSVLTLIAAAAGTWAAGRYFQKKIGGITGDCLGATSQLIELVCYLSLVVELPRATA